MDDICVSAGVNTLHNAVQPILCVHSVKAGAVWLFPHAVVLMHATCVYVKRDTASLDMVDYMKDSAQKGCTAHADANLFGGRDIGQ